MYYEYGWDVSNGADSLSFYVVSEIEKQLGQTHQAVDSIRMIEEDRTQKKKSAKAE